MARRPAADVDDVDKATLGAATKALVANSMALAAARIEQEELTERLMTAEPEGANTTALKKQLGGVTARLFDLGLEKAKLIAEPGEDVVSPLHSGETTPRRLARARGGSPSLVLFAVRECLIIRPEGGKSIRLTIPAGETIVAFSRKNSASLQEARLAEVIIGGLPEGVTINRPALAINGKLRVTALQCLGLALEEAHGEDIMLELRVGAPKISKAVSSPALMLGRERRRGQSQSGEVASIMNRFGQGISE
ncbi:MAG: hypothetical protein COB66_03790 [Coxiella sp. (in: Bacteria)]|nr:MAG: hypothetical protein COB66_03790 [Coxiella sp. (in: g-proteobacteria)]